MPPKMTNKGRLRGAKATVIRLLKANKQRGAISKPKPFSKLSPLEKDRVIPECLTNKINASKYNTHTNNFSRNLICNSLFFPPVVANNQKRRVDRRLFLSLFDRRFL